MGISQEENRDLADLQSAIEAFPDAVMVFDESSRLVTCNKKALPAFATPEDASSRKTHEELIKTVLHRMLDPNAFMRAARQYWENPEVEHSDIYETKDGRIMERYGVPKYLNGKFVGQIMGIRTVAGRVLAERRLQASEARFRTLSESNLIGIVHGNWAGEIIAANDYFLELVGYTLEDFKSGRVRWTEISAPEYKEAQERFKKEVLTTGAGKPFEKAYIRKDGSRVWALVGAALVDRQKEEISTFILDITARKQAEEALRTSEERMRSVFEGGGIPMAYGDPRTGSIVRANRAFTEMLGYTEEELSEIGIDGITLPEDRKTGAETYQKMFAGEIEGYRVEKRYVCKDGRVLWVDATGSLVRDANGKPFIGVGMVVDITARREAEESLKTSEARFRSIFENAHIGIAMAAIKDGIYRANPEFKRMLGYTEEELAELTPLDITHPLDRVETEKVFGGLMAGKSDHHRYEKRYVRKGGEVVWVDNSISLIRDSTGRPEYTIAMALDITARKKVEEALRQAHLEAKRAVVVRDEFIAIASHELRTPITPLKMQVQFIKNHLASGEFSSYPRAKELLKIVSTSEHQLGRLQTLIDSMLDTSRISAGKLTLDRTEFDMSGLIHEVTDRYRDELSHAGCEMKLELKSELRGSWDRGKIDQVLVNLLTNAMKYGRGKLIEISASQVHGSVQVVVRDHGIGISAADQARIFGPFERIMPVNTYGGFGLGLYIAHEIVTAHDGIITVQSEPGAGAVFTVELPTNQPRRTP